MGEIFTDVRGEDRTMRISHHSDRDVVVVSLWLDGICRASFRLASGDVDRFTEALLAMRPAPIEPPVSAPPVVAADPAPPDSVLPDAVFPDAVSPGGPESAWPELASLDAAFGTGAFAVLEPQVA
jgi:hypothetical protein